MWRENSHRMWVGIRWIIKNQEQKSLKLYSYNQEEIMLLQNHVQDYPTAL